MNSTQLRSHIARILQDPKIQTISFSLQGAHVTGPELGEIGRLVLSGHISVRVDAALISGGEFDFSSNTMVYPSYNSSVVSSHQN